MLTFSAFISIACGIIVVGFLSASAFYAREVDGISTTRNLIKRAGLIAAIWAIAEAFTIVSNLAAIIDSSIFDALDSTSLRSYITQTSLGKVQFYSVIGALLVSSFSQLVRKTGGIVALLMLALASLLLPLFQSHGSQSGLHGLAIGAIVFHVAALALWIGGVVALFFLPNREEAIPRFSVVALWCAGIVGASGVASAYTRLNFLAAWSSSYSLLVALKTALFVTLVFFGARHRQFIIRSLHGTRAVVQLLIGEIFVMTGATFVGVWLSQTQPPELDKPFVSDPALALTGVPMASTPTFSKILLAYEADGLILGGLILVTALYIRGVVILSRRGVKWPMGRTISFALGISAIDFATSGGLGVYSHFAFSWHMVAHMVLGMIAPIGIILGAPLTLLLRNLPAGRTSDERGLRGYVVSILHSRYFMTITHPIVALAIFDGSLFALYLTPIFGNLMTGHMGHVLMDIHFILAGALFFHVIVGIDPNPRKVPHLIRVIILFAAMSIHAFFSLALISMNTLLDNGYFKALQRPWWSDLLADQKLGGSIGWAMGEIPILIALIATFIQWVRADSREAERIERKSQRDHEAGRDDELDAYNRYLEGLAFQDIVEEDRKKRE